MSTKKLKKTTTLQKLIPQISAASVNAHVIAPAHVRRIQMEVVDPAKEVTYGFPRVVRQFKKTPELNLHAFGAIIHATFRDLVTGYILQVRHNGKLTYNLIWNWAQTPADKRRGWNENTRMHLASVSKFLTAVGVVKALEMKNISINAKIAGYLPTYWRKGKDINKITFRHLLRHRSGFSTGGSSSNFGFMKRNVASGVSKVGKYDYENMNFGLCRILIPIVLGKVAKSAKFSNNSSVNDKSWDLVTLHHYKSFMQTKVFSPAGVHRADFVPKPVPRNALAYKYPHQNKKGWNSGNLASMAGGAGWRLSSKEMLNVMNYVRRRNTIISPSKAQSMLDNFYGIDQVISTPAGKTYNKNGLWRSGDRTEQCVAYFLPQGMEVVVFVNSPIGTSGYSLRSIVNDAYNSSLCG